VTSGFYLASCFAPNHKGMTILEDDARMSFLEQQVVTGRSVTGGKLTELILLGLNHQTEHHLFPQTPRYKLHRITPHLQVACDEHGIHFERASFLKTNRDILAVLRAVAREAASGMHRKSLKTAEAVEEAKALVSASGGD
jgi:fatty acid desaturase